MEYNIEDIYIVKNDLKEFISNNKFDDDVYFTDNSRCICKLALDLRYRYDNINQVVDFYRDYMLNGIIDLSYLDYFFKYIKKEYRLNDLICFYNFVFQGCVSKTKVNIINKIVSNYSTNKQESEFLSLIENDFNQFSQLLEKYDTLVLWLEKFNEDKIYEYLSYLDKKNIAAMAATIIYICSLLLGLDFYFLLNPSNVFILNVESLGGIGTLDVGIKDDEDVFYSVKNNEHEAIWKKGRDYIYININRRMYRVGFDLSLIM